MNGGAAEERPVAGGRDRAEHRRAEHDAQQQPRGEQKEIAPAGEGREHRPRLSAGSGRALRSSPVSPAPRFLPKALLSIRAAVLHRTEYTYDRPVDLAPQVIRLRPAPHARTPVSGYAMKLTLEHATPRGDARRVEPFVNWQQDPQANWLARVVVPEAVTRFAVEVSLRCDLSPINPFDFFLDAEAETFPFAYGPDLSRQLAPYLERAWTPVCGAGFDAMLGEVRNLIAPTNGEDPADHRRGDGGQPARAGAAGLPAALRGRHPDARGDDRDRQRQLPRLRLAAGAAAARAGPGGPLRVGILHSVGARREAAGRRMPPPASPATWSTCTPGRRSTCRAPAGSGSTRPRG